jgi:hypothetical protein
MITAEDQTLNNSNIDGRHIDNNDFDRYLKIRLLENDQFLQSFQCRAEYVYSKHQFIICKLLIKLVINSFEIVFQAQQKVI